MALGLSHRQLVKHRLDLTESSAQVLVLLFVGTNCFLQRFNQDKRDDVPVHSLQRILVFQSQSLAAQQWDTKQPFDLLLWSFSLLPCRGEKELFRRFGLKETLMVSNANVEQGIRVNHRITDFSKSNDLIGWKSLHQQICCTIRRIQRCNPCRSASAKLTPSSWRNETKIRRDDYQHCTG